MKYIVLLYIISYGFIFNFLPAKGSDFLFTEDELIQINSGTCPVVILDKNPDRLKKFLKYKMDFLSDDFGYNFYFKLNGLKNYELKVSIKCFDHSYYAVEKIHNIKTFTKEELLSENFGLSAVDWGFLERGILEKIYLAHQYFDFTEQSELCKQIINNCLLMAKTYFKELPEVYHNNPFSVEDLADILECELYRKIDYAPKYIKDKRSNTVTKIKKKIEPLFMGNIIGFYSTFKPYGVLLKAQPFKIATDFKRGSSLEESISINLSLDGLLRIITTESLCDLFTADIQLKLIDCDVLKPFQKSLKEIFNPSQIYKIITSDNSLDLELLAKDLSKLFLRGRDVLITKELCGNFKIVKITEEGFFVHKVKIHEETAVFFSPEELINISAEDSVKGQKLKQLIV